MDIRKFLTPEEKNGILAAIRDAENNTSGEIRLHLENRCKGDVIDRAVFLFDKLGMTATRESNGVLFYVAVKDKKLAILGDKGINKTVPENFWENIREHLVSRFRENKYGEGLAEGIRMAGEQLKSHFPLRSDDKNELTDEISYGGSS
ncbi:MAG: TPM domain-containing protein [Flavobacteriales bacterium]|nr:TPM domain-containing protein [Flavobacteriales bacterium]MCB9448265.1 TPM domain-containing protein [Flavobacteriales bacterium]